MCVCVIDNYAFSVTSVWESMTGQSENLWNVNTGSAHFLLLLVFTSPPGHEILLESNPIKYTGRPNHLHQLT